MECTNWLADTLYFSLENLDVGCFLFLGIESAATRFDNMFSCSNHHITEHSLHVSKLKSRFALKFVT